MGQSWGRSVTIGCGENGSRDMRVGFEAAPMAAAAAFAVFTGMGVVAIRFVVTEWEPATLAFYRFGIASVTILPFLALSRSARLERRDIVPVCLLGAAFFGLYPWLFAAGMVHIPASRGAVIFGAMPLAAMIVAAALRLEALTGLKSLGAALAFGGVALALGDRAALGADADDAWIGELLTGSATLLLAINFVLFKPWLRKYPALTVASWSILAGAVFLIPFAAWEGAFAGIPELSAARWWAVALLGVFAGSLGYFLWIWALQCSTPTRSAVFIVLNPMTATLLGAVLLAETISPAFLLGLAGVVAGILVANWQPGSRVASPD